MPISIGDVVQATDMFDGWNDITPGAKYVVLGVAPDGGIRIFNDYGVELELAFETGRHKPVIWFSKL